MKPPSLADRCRIHAQKMSDEGWHVTSNVLASAAEALDAIGPKSDVADRGSAPSPSVSGGDQKRALLKGEGEVQFVRRERVRVECESCGEDADRLHHFQLPSARRNPASAGYGRDDISRVSDRQMHACTTCFPDGKRPQIDGYEWSGMYTDPVRYPHLFLRWAEKIIETAKATA